jgi:hypothetical protein
LQPTTAPARKKHGSSGGGRGDGAGAHSSPSLPDSDERHPRRTIAGGPARVVAAPAPSTPRCITLTGARSSEAPAAAPGAPTGDGASSLRRTRTGVGSSGCSRSPCRRHTPRTTPHHTPPAAASVTNRTPPQATHTQRVRRVVATAAKGVGAPWGGAHGTPRPSAASPAPRRPSCSGDPAEAGTQGGGRWAGTRTRGGSTSTLPTRCVGSSTEACALALGDSRGGRACPSAHAP